MKARSLRNMLAWLAMYLAAGLITTAVAQDAAATDKKDEKKDETVKLEKFVVTGSLIPVAAGSTAIPVSVVTSVDIEKSGVSTDVLQVLKKTQPNFYGANNIGSDNGNISSGSTNGGSAVALRNRATLVLINGRRAPVAPVLASGGGNFVDVSLVPLAAIERIEVLSDGASATYGSDAVSGVVNIILKSNYNGVELAGRYGWSPNRSNYAERSYSAIAGGSSGKTNVTITTGWRKDDPLRQQDRDFALGQFRTPSFAGVINSGTNFYYLNPSLNAPPVTSPKLTIAQLIANGTYSGPYTQDQVAQFFDLAQYPTMLIARESRSFTAAVDHAVTDSMKVFGDFMYTINESTSVLNAQPVSGTVTTASVFSPLTTNYTVRNRFVNFPRIYAAESTSTRGVVGIKGSLVGSWNYEAAANYNRTIQHFRNYNLIDAVTYQALIDAGRYNPFARVQAPGVIESMLGTSFRDYQSELIGYDVRVNGEVFDLPAGPVQMAFGAETRRDLLKFTNDRYDQTGQWLAATPRQPFAAQQSVDGIFAEARIPVFDKTNAIPGFHVLELSLAARHDIYSKTSDPTVPKYSIRWLPFNDDLAFRATYTESFSAPTLYDLLGPVSVGFTSGINIARYDSAGNALGTTTGSRQYRSQSGSNPNLNPSRSRSWTAGVIWSPQKIKALKGLTVTATWFDLDERDLISSISSSLIVQSVERYGAASPYASLVRLGQSVSGETHFADGAAITAPGQMSSRPSDEVWISNSIVNVAGFWQSGMDFKVDYKYDTNTVGVFNASVTGTYLRQYNIQSLPTTLPFNYASSFSGSSVYPRWHTYTTLDWSYKNWGAQISHFYIPQVDDVANATYYKVSSYSTFDLQASYRFASSTNKWLAGLELNVGMNNVFNKFPPLTPSEGNQSHDINTYDAIGRFIYFGGKYKF